MIQNSVIEFDENDKWIVVSEKEIDGIKYLYLIKIDNTEENVMDEMKIVKSYLKDDIEYMEDVEDKELLKKILPIFIPESKEYLESI